MAIQFARMEYVSRSQGKNACCKVAYNARERIVDHKTNVTYTFERLCDLEHSEILLPSYVNGKFKKYEVFANEVERNENRKNSQLFKEYVLALPDDPQIKKEDREELVRRFIDKMQFVQNGLGVQLSIHKPHDGEHNWHAHLLVTTRRFREDGQALGAKARDLNLSVRGGSKYFVTEDSKDNMGGSWKDMQNEYFKEKDLELRVEAISNTPGSHIGPVRMRGIIGDVAQFHEEKRIAALKSIRCGNDLLDEVTKRAAVFSESDLTKILRSIGEFEGKYALLKEAFSSSRVQPLFRADGSETKLWTTKEVRAEEQRALRVADVIHTTSVNSNLVQMRRVAIDECLADGKISQHQKEALSHLIGDLINSSGLKIMQGRAGTGKSHLLGELNEIASKYQKVIGLAPTHIAAAGLKEEGYDTARTVKGFLFQHKNGRVDLPRGSLIVVDEAGMLGTESYLELLKVVRGSKSELILSGDRRQLTSVERSGLFEVLTDRYGCAELAEVRRQENDWGREISEAFSVGDAARGVEILKQQDKLFFSEDKADSCSQLLNDWAKSEVELKDRIIISIANKDVDALNSGAREHLKAQGLLQGPEFKIENNNTKGVFSEGDRIVFTKTDKDHDVKNGNFGEIIKAVQGNFTVRLDNEKEVSFDPKNLQFKLGYAATVYKAQGASIRDVYVFHANFSTKENAYVSMSRHIQFLRLYCNMQNTSGVAALINQLSNVVDRGSSLHYMAAEDFTNVDDKSTLNKIGAWLKDGVTAISDILHENKDYYVFNEEQHVSANKVEAILESENVALQKVVGLEESFCYVKPQLEAINAMPSKSLNNNSQSVNANLNVPSNWTVEMARTRHELKFCSERVARDLLGEPNTALSSAKTLRYGEHGRMAIELTGPKAGLWHDFSAGVGGDVIALIQKERQVDFKDAVKISKDYISSAFEPSMTQEKPLKNIAENTDVSEKVQKAQALYEKSIAIDGNDSGASKPVNLYLTEQRGILVNAPDDVRMIPELWHYNARENMPAMAVFARNKEGEITGAHAIYLNSDGSKADIKPNRQSLGQIKGSYVEIQTASIGFTVIAEGVETALSLKEAEVPGRILCSLGVKNLKNYEPAVGETVVIAADNDGKNAAVSKALDSAVVALEERGANVVVVQPAEKGNFNDVLKIKGIEAVYNQVMLADNKGIAVVGDRIMGEIEKNHQYLEQSWEGRTPVLNDPRGDKDFGVVDFNGEKHTTVDSYLLGVGRDPSVKGFIDKDSALGKSIQEEVGLDLDHERGRGI